MCRVREHYCINKICFPQHEIATLAEVPAEYTRNRRARIFRPAKSAMQSGTFHTQKWRVEFDTQQRWENPTMGWQSKLVQYLSVVLRCKFKVIHHACCIFSADAISNMAMDFTTEEAAIRYCQQQGRKSSHPMVYNLSIFPIIVILSVTLSFVVQVGSISSRRLSL